jgi:uncharacterized protein (DUF1778 family)
MSDLIRPRQKRVRLPISSPMSADEIAIVDRAAAIRDESRAAYIRRVAVREARAELRRANREHGDRAVSAA